MAKRKGKGFTQIGNLGPGAGMGSGTGTGLSDGRKSGGLRSSSKAHGAKQPRRTADDPHGSAGRHSSRSRQGFSAHAGDGPQLSAHRVGDIMREPTARRRRFSGKLVVVLVVIVAVIAAIVAGTIILGNSSAFKIEQMVVNGVKHLTAEEMAELAEIPQGATLINIDTAAVSRNLKRDAWIQEVDIKRVFPHTLEVNVTERVVTAVIEIPTSDASDTRLWAMSSDGMWLMPIPERESEAGKLINQQIYEDIENVLHIVDVPFGQQPEIGTFCTDDNVNNALTIVSSLTTSLSEQVATVRATDPASTTLILKNGVEIAFGAAEDIRDKERVCLELLERYNGQIAYINVRAVDSPTWRSL